MKKISLIGTLIGFASLLTFAQNTFSQTVQGMIFDSETHHPLNGATILLKGQNLHTHSQKNGTFKLNTVNYPDTLQISYLGYATQQLVLRYDQQNIEILMQKVHVSLKQVEVNGVRNISSQLMKVDLNQTPVNTTQDLLRKVPGLFIAQHAGGGKAEQIFLRGFDADHGTDVNISVDGIPVNMVSHAHGQGYADLHFVIPETVDVIDFGKGAYYTDKGDLNTAGYVAFNTKNQLQNSLVKLEAGAFNTLRTLAMLNLVHKNNENEGKSTDAYVAAEYNFTNGPFQNPQDFNRINLFAKYHQWLNPNERIGVIASTFNSNWNASGQIPERAIDQGIVPYFGSLDPTEGGRTSRTNLQVNYENHLDENHTFTSMAYYTKYKFSLFSNFTFFANNQDKGDGIHQFEDRQLVGMDHRYSGTIKLANSKLNYYVGTALRFDNIGQIGLNHIYRRNELLLTSAKGSGNELNTNLYANADWHLGKWIVNPGIRADYFVFAYNNQLLANETPTQSTSAMRVSPKLNFFYNANRQLQLFLKTGMGFHSNDMRVLTQLNSAKEALPISKGADLGATIKPMDGLIIQPTLWYLYLQQEFVYVGDEAVVEPSGRSQRLGIDMSVRYQPNSWLYLYTDWNWARPRFLDVPATESYIPLAPHLTSTGGATVQFAKPFSASVSYRYMKNRPGNEDNSAIAKGYFVNDLTLTYQLKRVTFSLQCQNLWDVKWREAQFFTETRLRSETQNVSDMAITPGIPRFIKGSIAFNF